MIKLAIVSTHPIQYYAPIFRLLAKSTKLKIKVYYTWGETVLKDKYDPGFGKIIEWDIPLLEGYEYEFVTNISKEPGSHHFKGIINPDLNKRIESWSPDAILMIGWSFHAHLKCMRYFSKKNVPILFRGDSNLLDPIAFHKKIIRKLFLTWVYKHIDYALYVGTNNRNYYLEYGVKEKQLIYSPHAIDNERFSENEQNKVLAADFRKKLGIKPNDIVFLFAGKLESKKAPELLIAAFLSLKDQENIHLVIVGNGVLENDLKAKYSKIDNIHFVDFQNQSTMPVIYKLCDIFVLPSNGPGETWGLAINEAMASGKVVIASDKVGGAVDLIEENVKGYTFQSGNLNQLKEKMSVSVAKNGELGNMGLDSAKKIKKWSFSAIVDSIENLLAQ